MLALSGCSPQPTTETSGEGPLTWTECKGQAAPEAKCGVVRVEENRAAPNGRTIDLAFVVAPALARSPAADPVFLLAGGPGQGAAALAPMILGPLEPLRAERDLVFVDLRGTGSSNPLPCEIDDPEDLAKLLAPAPALDQLDACLADYEARGGVDLTQYTSEAMVEDLEQVRAALGYEQINLLGISYGTALAQVYMREHGEALDRVILDGAVPLDESASLQMPGHAERALEALLGDCRADQACAAAFPGLERKLAVVLDELGENRALEAITHPRTGEAMRVELTPAGFVGALGGALYSSKFAALIPLAIERAHAGDYDPIAALALRLAKMSGSVNMGLYLAVTCAEDLDTLTPETRAAALAELDYFNRAPELELLEQACARWPHAESEGYRVPVEASIPTLILSGAYDPVTPPIYGERLAARLANARHVEVAHASHGIWHLGCAPELMAEFFAADDPASVDASCLERLALPGIFLNPNGPWPLAAKPGAGASSRALAQGQP